MYLVVCRDRDAAQRVGNVDGQHRRPRPQKKNL